ncbi:hypothetical protein NLX85_24520 [Micromonospora sp. A3M-1-15]|uniref:hypothetical protein n=1 Tax=Micromonospora sp. A3M-1-15 TaxID=2962035 RepID=UPI0020B6C648|nr:hypothetical protein [Micromonospora sp. A3M-1-15]MCP3786536.1 hypothetical protein [Micromonospora sp. A3M-1-15]
MNAALRELVERGGGLVTRAVAEQVVPEWTLRRACGSGDLVRVLPEVFVAAHLLNDRPEQPAIGRLDPAVGIRAAQAWADGRGALSHLSALATWGLRRPRAGDLLHLSAPAGAGIRSRPGVAVHRRQGLLLDPPHVVVRRGLTVTRLEQALVDSWPLLPSGERRAPVIRAVNDRLTTPQRLVEAMRAAPKQWYGRTWRPQLTDLKIGWESYGGAADTLWFDDVALGATRIGC